MPIQIESQLCPLVHQYNWSLYRVPLRRIGDDHTVFLGNGKTRIYTAESLPDCIKFKLTMVLASPDVALHDETKRDFGIHHLMINNSAAHMNDIGWRASDTYFVVVIESEDLDSLIGESLHKEQ
jgi:hypothetical protein